MSKAEYWQRGEVIDYVNDTEAKIEANQIIAFGEHVGDAGTSIEIGETGSLHVFGVFEFPKSSGNAIAAGTTVYFDGEGITEAADNGQDAGSKVSYACAGYATEAAGADDTVIKVKLLG